MARTIKTPTAPVEPPAIEQPTYTFHPFKWTPDSLPRDTTVSARELCGLVDHVKDVVSGAALVFELLSAHDCDIDSETPSYLSPYYLGLLRCMAMRSLDSLDDKAGEIASRLHQMARGKA